MSKRGVLGHEFDSVIDNGFSPPGLIELSETYVDNVQYIMDHGSIFDTGTARHSIALYRSKSGSLVFGAGTVQWAWALDSNHDANDPPRANMYSTRVENDPLGPELALQQLTLNVLSDMGISPDASALSAHHPKLVFDARDPQFLGEPPKAVVSSARVLFAGARSIIAVTASAQAQAPRGTVASVECSFNGGKRWHKAQRASLDPSSTAWFINFGEKLWQNASEYISEMSGTDVTVRAIDDSLNVGPASAAAHIPPFRPEL